ncbi:hypothetical protein GCM10011320_42620 [Neoroseomonas lacus]|uniref:Uncharacterized protein n=1 Tax=Neoroseomonas lacus TaxID=287609 RepID=A0A917KV01_9PROT|nr:hypothetical protein GCM10011320_42620 [Neoroseomonas lacus]
MVIDPTPDTIMTTLRTVMMFVVVENDIANFTGKSAPERVVGLYNSRIPTIVIV